MTILREHQGFIKSCPYRIGLYKGRIGICTSYLPRAGIMLSSTRRQEEIGDVGIGIVIKIPIEGYGTYRQVLHVIHGASPR